MGKLPTHLFHAGRKRRVLRYDERTKMIHLDNEKDPSTPYVVRRGGAKVPVEKPAYEQGELFKRGKPMSDQQLAHRKRIQAHTSQAGSTAGLTSLGLLGASAIAGKKGMKLAPKLKAASTNTAIVGAGIGGASGFNFARIQSEEARRSQVKKGSGMKLVAKAYDPEGNRRKRQKGYTAALAGGSTGAAVTSGGFALRAVRNSSSKQAGTLREKAKAYRAAGDQTARTAKAVGDQGAAAKTYVPNMPARNRGGQASAANAEIKRGEALARKASTQRKAAVGAEQMAEKATKHAKTLRATGLKRAGIAAGASAALAGAAAANERHRKRGGQTYNGWWEHRY